MARHQRNNEQLLVEWRPARYLLAWTTVTKLHSATGLLQLSPKNLRHRERGGGHHNVGVIDDRSSAHSTGYGSKEILPPGERRCQHSPWLVT
jgi:hypothetical protein